jgi:hypothetical protein
VNSTAVDLYLKKSFIDDLIEGIPLNVSQRVIAILKGLGHQMD